MPARSYARALFIGARRRALIVVTIAFAALSGPAAAFDKFIALGTGSREGVFSPVGAAICDLINAGRLDHLVRCVAYQTGGSVYNLQALVSGEIDVALTRADLADQAYKGSGAFATVGANRELRLITGLYGQPVAVIVKTNAGISGFGDFAGRKINIGNRGSGKRTIAESILRIMGWTNEHFASVSELDTQAMGDAFCAGKVDILIESLGLPATFYEQVTRKCGGMFLSLPDRVIAELKRTGPYFHEDAIRGGAYPNNPTDIRTLSIKIVLVTTSRVAPRSIGVVSQSVFDNVDRFRSAHSALTPLTAKSMLRVGIDIPFHDGAARYFHSRSLTLP